MSRTMTIDPTGLSPTQYTGLLNSQLLGATDEQLIRVRDQMLAENAPAQAVLEALAATEGGSPADHMTPEQLLLLAQRTMAGLDAQIASKMEEITERVEAAEGVMRDQELVNAIRSYMTSEGATEPDDEVPMNRRLAGGQTLAEALATLDLPNDLGENLSVRELENVSATLETRASQINASSERDSLALQTLISQRAQSMTLFSQTLSSVLQSGKDIAGNIR
ncbi:MAG: hypothetical protein AAGH15_19620 [Myxococcota bacterium]